MNPRADRTGRGSLAGRLRLDDGWDDPGVNDAIAAAFRPLRITAEHAAAAGRLPLLHSDPFDRLLIAQARCAGLTLVTRDAQIRRYDVAVLPV